MVKLGRRLLRIGKEVLGLYSEVIFFAINILQVTMLINTIIKTDDQFNL